MLSGVGLGSDAARLLVLQTVLGLAVALAFTLLESRAAGTAALAGAGIALVNALLLARRVRMAEAAARARPGEETTQLFIGFVERFAVVVGLFAFTLGWLRLPALPLLAAFAFAQVAFVLSGRLHRVPGVGDGRGRGGSGARSMSPGKPGEIDYRE